MVYWRHGWGYWRSNGRSFFDDLMWAMANCGGIVRVIVVVRDRTANPRARTADCYPAKDLLMRVVHFDPAAGSFRLEQVVPAIFVRAGNALGGRERVLNVEERLKADYRAANPKPIKGAQSRRG
jgi:hypothetical protein